MTNKTWQKWTLEEVELLKIHWKSATMKELLDKFPNRQYNSLMLKATQLGVRSEIKRKRIGSLDFLDILTNSSCYWWGFIISDGHITNKGELIITLNKLDSEHLMRLAVHLNRYVTLREQFVTLRIQDKRFGEKWLSTLKISSAKTYTPPDLSVFLTQENLLPFFIGLVDGDGCIWESKKWLNLRIELHGNWVNTLQLIANKLKEFYDIDCKVRTTKKGTSKLDINTKKDLRILKSYINNVEYLKRKWSKLDTL